MTTYTAVYFGAVLVTMILVPLVSRLAKRYRLVDAPGPRKVHQIPIPRVGGIAFMASTLAVVLPVFLLEGRLGWSFRGQQTQLLVVLAAAGFMFAVGLIDDFGSVRGRTKLLCLIGASVAVCASGATLRFLSFGPWFEGETGWAAWPLSVLWITIVTISISLIDGVDGLAGGIAAIVCGTVALMAYLAGQTALVVLMLAVLGGVTGFLFFNFHPAKIFMGDGGSMFLGFLIGAGSIACQTKASAAASLAPAFLALGVPMFDMVLAVARRCVLERRSAFAPDRKHLHHRLLDLGLSQRTVVVIICAITAINAGLGVFLTTTESPGKAALLAGSGLLLLLSLFAYLSADRSYAILMTLSRNWQIVREARLEQRSFERAELQMRDAGSFEAWWETLCGMGSRMHFHSIELWSRRQGQLASVRVWYAPVVPMGRTAQLALPLRGNGVAEWEMRASIGVNGYLELGGRQAMLLARLMDEFPPPEQMKETEGSVGAPTGHIDTPHKRKEVMTCDDSTTAASPKNDVYSHTAPYYGNSGDAL